MKRARTYKILITYNSFKDRFEYLRLDSAIGYETFGHDRWINQLFYSSDPKYLQARRDAIIRDNACDLGIPGLDISSFITVHHINPITKDDIIHGRNCCYDLDNLISTRSSTHRQIHYGNSDNLYVGLQERKPGDTCLWR